MYISIEYCLIGICKDPVEIPLVHKIGKKHQSILEDIRVLYCHY